MRSRSFWTSAPEEGDEASSPSDESPYTDDLVRVYLREMGSISLLTRQGEVVLARRMERGKLLVRKHLSRTPMIHRMAMAICEDLRQGKRQAEGSDGHRQRRR